MVSETAAIRRLAHADPTAMGREIYALLLQQSSDAILIFDADTGCILDSNPAACKLFGYQRYRMRTIHASQLSADPFIFDRDLKAVLRSGKIKVGERRFRRSDGSIVAAQSAFVSPSLPSIKVAGVQSSDCVVGLICRAEPESWQTSEAMSELGALVGEVAHEVRNPLFSIATLIAAFELTVAYTPEQQRYINHLKSEIERLNRIMNSLLAFGETSFLKRSETDLLALVRTAVEQNATQIEQRGIRASIESTGYHLVSIDPERMLEAVHNVIENAIQHSPENGMLSIEIVRHEDTAIVSVRDQGQGFSEESLRHALEPFFSRRREGTGLGLSIAQRVLLKHGGEIRIANHPEGGGWVVLTLPTAET
jgi:PAS domain S-box-containing protein